MGEPLNEEDGSIIKEEVEIFAPYCQIIIHLKGLSMKAWCKTDVAQHNLVILLITWNLLSVILQTQSNTGLCKYEDSR